MPARVLPGRPAPDPALLEQGRFGALPRVGADGRTSIRAYAGQFDRQDTRPRVGIIVADIGISNAQTEDAIRRLPPAVTFAISPYAPRAAQVAERLRAKGAETLIGLPLEPAGYPLNDPGNRALPNASPPWSKAIWHSRNRFVIAACCLWMPARVLPGRPAPGGARWM